ncbi:MAG: hypothetical protein JWM78_2283 [Verrucomicrobiaceae bacterium]|nr:hypothetical protein [Verrucomicrobiaceae bacterium]
MQLFSMLPYLALGFFLVILCFIEIGRRVGVSHLRRDPDGARVGIAAIEGAIFGLLGLMIAFTFSGAAARMEVRRDLIVAETNAIGTAWLRLDLLPEDAQPELRQLFRDYVDQRIAYFHEIQNKVVAAQHDARAVELQSTIWKKSGAVVKTMTSVPLGVSELQAQNDMFDITTTRGAALEAHPPLAIYGMLAVLTLISGLLIGFGMAGSSKRNWFHSVGYALVMVSALYLILDFEFPRAGSIRIDHVDTILLDLRKSFD